MASCLEGQESLRQLVEKGGGGEDASGGSKDGALSSHDQLRLGDCEAALLQVRAACNF